MFLLLWASWVHHWMMTSDFLPLCWWLPMGSSENNDKRIPGNSSFFDEFHENWHVVEFGFQRIMVQHFKNPGQIRDLAKAYLCTWANSWITVVACCYQSVWESICCGKKIFSGLWATNTMQFSQSMPIYAEHATECMPFFSLRHLLCLYMILHDL